MSTAAISKLAHIMVIEDNPGDVLLLQEAIQEAQVNCQLTLAPDGIVALAMLRRVPPYADTPRPDLILLDLNLPKKNGHEVLAELKSDLHLHRIPTIIFTSSQAQRDVVTSFEYHANAHLCKPDSLPKYVELVHVIQEMWLKSLCLVESPR